MVALLNDDSTVVCALEVTSRVSLPFGRPMRNLEMVSRPPDLIPRDYWRKEEMEQIGAMTFVIALLSSIVASDFFRFELGHSKAKQNNFLDEKSFLS